MLFIEQFLPQNKNLSHPHLESEALQSIPFIVDEVIVNTRL
jgi:hypothetical protein